MLTNNATQIPLEIVGSSTFGRYPKISLEKTYNMFISDGWLVNYAGFELARDILSQSVEGRALFHSVRGKFLIAVVGSAVYKLTSGLVPEFIGTLDTTIGEVYIDENLNSQISLVDGQAAYIYNYSTHVFKKQTLTFAGNDIRPNYVCYHNSFFLVGSSPGSVNDQLWYVFDYDPGNPNDMRLNGSPISIQTKPDVALAVKRLPGRGNNVLVLGSTVCEIWTQVGGTENYRRTQSANIDQGCVNVSTIAANEEFLCFLAQNENNAPSILVTNSTETKRISSDGIDYLLQTIKFPEQSTAFFYRQDGHLFYQLTFFNSADNLTLVYDFNTNKFYHASDEELNFHPARQVVYYEEKTYFVSLNDASLYAMSTDLISYKYTADEDDPGKIIPRIRICKEIRLDDCSRFVTNMITFWVEQGVDNNWLIDPDGIFCDGLLVTEDGVDFIVTEDGDNILAEDGVCAEVIYQPSIDLSFSKNGGLSFSSPVRKYLNVSGHYRNQIRWWRMGFGNEFTPQFRFIGLQRFVVHDGLAEVVKQNG